MTRYVLRVDDVGQAVHQQHEPDVGLRYFRQWWKAGGWGDEPIYLGVVPAQLMPEDVNWLLEIENSTKAEICIHGWDHEKWVLTPEAIERASAIFPGARCVIPPYNLYDRATIEATALLGPNAVLFGGFHEPSPKGREADHEYGLRPVLVDGVLHLSADRRFYERCDLMAASVRAWSTAMETVPKIMGVDYPLVVTAHLRWDVDHFGGVVELREALAGRLVTAEEARPK